MIPGYSNTKKPLALLGGIFFIVVLVLIFVLELRFFKQLVQDYDTRVQQIALNDMNTYLNEIEYTTKSIVKHITNIPSEEPAKILHQIQQQDPRVEDFYVVNLDYEVMHSTSDTLPPQDFRERIATGYYDFYFLSNQEISQVNHLYVAAEASDDLQNKGYIILCYNISDFQKQLILKYSHDKFKVSIIDEHWNPVVWPFPQTELKLFSPEHEVYHSGEVKYHVDSVKLPNSMLTAYFFFEDTNFVAYRIITIILLLFGLYILIYQLIVEVLNLNTAHSYFEHIDFSIFNNLNEGIIIANKFDKILFANSAACEIFHQKNIFQNTSNLRDVIGNYNTSVRKIILKKSDKFLEIIPAPIFKHGKLLGTLVVISISMEKEKFCSNALGKIVTILSDGMILVDKYNRIVLFNMMANYYLGSITEGMNINLINPELSSLIEKNIGSPALRRARLESGTICEFLTLYNESGSYAGTVIFLKNSDPNLPQEQ